MSSWKNIEKEKNAILKKTSKKKYGHERNVKKGNIILKKRRKKFIFKNVEKEKNII